MINPKGKRRVLWLSILLAVLGSAARPVQELPPPPRVAPPLPAESPTPAPPPQIALLRPGQTLTLRVLQVIPAEGLSPGERLLNSRNPILPGDHFLAEVMDPPCSVTTLVGGSIVKVVRPGWFGRPGYVTLQLAQLVQTVDGSSHEIPWQVNTEDRQLASRMRRVLLSALLGVDGAGIGASMGAQFAPPHLNAAWIGSGAAIGLLLGVGYSSFQRGNEARLEPGDTFRIVVGSLKYQPISREWQTILYPAADPLKRKGKGK
jgi:hypothetical protein